MRTGALLWVAFLALAVPAPACAALVPYDSFDAGAVNTNRWRVAAEGEVTVGQSGGYLQITDPSNPDGQYRFGGAFGRGPLWLDRSGKLVVEFEYPENPGGTNDYWRVLLSPSELDDPDNDLGASDLPAERIYYQRLLRQSNDWLSWQLGSGSGHDYAGNSGAGRFRFLVERDPEGGSGSISLEKYEAGSWVAKKSYAPADDVLPNAFWPNVYFSVKQGLAETDYLNYSPWEQDSYDEFEDGEVSTGLWRTGEQPNASVVEEGGYLKIVRNSNSPTTYYGAGVFGTEAIPVDALGRAAVEYEVTAEDVGSRHYVRLALTPYEITDPLAVLSAGLPGDLIYMNLRMDGNQTWLQAHVGGSTIANVQGSWGPGTYRLVVEQFDESSGQAHLEQLVDDVFLRRATVNINDPTLIVDEYYVNAFSNMHQGISQFAFIRATVPEPSALVLLAMGGLGMAWGVARRRKR